MLVLFRVREGHSLLRCGEWHLGGQHPAGVRPPGPRPGQQPRHAARTDHGVATAAVSHWTLPYLSCDMLSCPSPVAMEYKGPQILHALSHILQTL